MIVMGWSSLSFDCKVGIKNDFYEYVPAEIRKASLTLMILK
jgi:hypothetical protein